MLAVRADAPFGGRLPAVERRLDLAAGSPFDPPTAPFRFFLVGRIADNDGDRLLALDLVRLAPRPRDRLEDLRQFLVLDEGIAERVGDVEIERERRLFFRLG